MHLVYQKPSGCQIIGIRDYVGYLTAWCTVEQLPGAVLVMTVRADNGEVVGYEVHTDEESPAASFEVHTNEEVGDFWEPHGGLTARGVRDIPFGELANLTRAALSRAIARHTEASEQGPPLFEEGSHHSTLEEWWHARDYVDAWKRAARMVRAASEHPGRRGHSDRHYARIAVAYEVWLKTGKPLRILAEELGLSEPGLRTALAKARAPERGLLTPAPRGQKGGRATDRARQLAMEDDDGVD
jgi:hypothetical protein